MSEFAWPVAVGGVLPSFLAPPAAPAIPAPPPPTWGAPDAYLPAAPLAPPPPLEVADPAAPMAPAIAAIPLYPTYPAYPAYPAPVYQAPTYPLPMYPAPYYPAPAPAPAYPSPSQTLLQDLAAQVAAAQAQLAQLLKGQRPAAPAPAPAQPKPAKPAPKPTKPEPAPKPKPNPLDGRGPLLQAGARGVPVRTLERRLDALGYDVGRPDSKFGAATVKAVRRFQSKNHLAVDGIVGKQTWKHLDVKAKGKVSYPGITRAQLNRGLRNQWFGSTHNCFRYAWSLVAIAGGKSIGAARQSREGRGQSTSYMATLTAKGIIKPGDIVYVNRKPGADPSSTNLAYGPHWFVYMGSGEYADQYGMKSSAAAMAAFVPGRYIDTIYHTA